MHKFFLSKVLIFAIAFGAILGGDLHAQTGPSVLTFTPARYSIQNPTVAITAQFDGPLNAATVIAGNVVVYGEQSGLHTGTLNYNPGNSTITFNPTTAFHAGELVTVIMTTAITGSSGTAIAGFQWSFYIRSNSATANFNADSTYTTANGPHYIGIGLLNEDTALDIAIPHSRDHSVRTWQNDGGGDFAVADNVPVEPDGISLRSLIIADFDLDGDLDIASANEATNNVSILLNNGIGDFSITDTLSVGLEPNSIAAGDFNSDGLPDLATANPTSNSISLLINAGAGTFANAVPVNVAASPQTLFIADFNNDGFSDMAVTTAEDSSVAILINDGSGNFAAPQSFAVGANPRGIGGRDFNKDGRIDLVVSNRDANNVSVLFNNGGSFSLPNNYGTGTDPVAIATGDWNGDGNSDFAVSNRLSADMQVFLNNGAGSFPGSNSFPLGNEPRGLNAGDFNGDGIVDLAAANFVDNTLLVLFNNFGAGENDPPGVPALTAPADRAYINPTTTPIQLSWNVPADIDNDQLDFRIEIATTASFANVLLTFDSRDDVTGFNPAPPVAQGVGSVAYALSAPLQDGSYFWRVTAWDGLTFGSPSTSRRFSVDSTVPNIDMVVITAPAFAPNWYNPTATTSINFGAQYDEARAQRADFNLGALGGLQTLQSIPSGQDRVAQVPVTFGPAVDGSYPLTVAIFDSAANQAGTNTTIRLDRTAPTGSSASSPSTTSDLSFVVTWGGTGSDGTGSGLSGIFNVRVQVDGGPWTAWLTNFRGNSSTYPDAEDGHTYGFEAAAHDNVGNIESFTNVAETQTVVDTSNDVSAPGPPINLTADGANPSPWKNTPNFQVQWQEPSDPSGIDETFYKLGAAPTSNSDITGSVQGGVTSVPVAATQQNGQNFYVWFSDGSGNVNFQNNASVALRFDNTPPTGTTANSPSVSVNPDFIVSWENTGSDGAGSQLSGFYDVRVRINNGQFSPWMLNFGSQSAIYDGEDGNTYAFEVAARDVAGNTEVFTGNAETTTEVDISANDVDPPGPPASLNAAGTNPSPWQTSPQFQVQWQPPADPSGIQRALYKLGAVPTANFDTTASVRSGNSVGVTVTQEDGQNFYIWFQDQRGNLDFRNRGVVQLRYDNTAPTVIGIEFPDPALPPNWFNQALVNQANAEITYDERHLRRIQLQAPTLGINSDVTNVPSGLGVSRQFSLDISGQPDGSHRLQFTLIDSADNSTTDSIRIALDGTSPAGTLANSPDTSSTATFLVSWGGTGSDGSGSGLSGVYDVRVQVNGGAWQNWLTNFSGDSNNFAGEDGNAYGFEAAALDRVGNREAFSGNPESVTFVDPTFQDILAPAIVHAPTTQVDAGQSVTLTAQISDNNQVQQALLFFRASGEVGFQSQQMTNTAGNSFEFTLSAGQISSTGINYFISATDGLNFSFDPPDGETAPYNISVRITGVNNQGLAKDDPQPGGGGESTYRMISVPLNLQVSNALAVLADDLGDYDPTNWRLFQYNAASDQYVEYPAVGTFTPGKAFWLIVRNPNIFVDSGVGTTVATSQPFTISLVRGWNDIALPFPFAVDSSDIQITQGNPSDVIGPYTFAGQWLLPNQVGVLQPWEGYSFYSENPATLTILPIASSTSGSSALAKTTFDSEWHLAIEASCGDLRDGANFIGVAAEARLERDSFDYLEPPYIANHVAVSFPHHDWSGINGAFTTDFRPLFDDGQVWRFEVESTLGNQPIALRFGNLESLPPEFHAIVLDRNTLKQHDLRQVSEYVFEPQRGESRREFDLVVGVSEYVENSEVLKDPLPQSFFLSQNFPNPFNAGTTITYRVAESAQVTVKVVNILGQKVRELVSQRHEPGLYRVNWDGSADSGVAISSGIYLIQMEAGDFRQIRKMVLVR